MKKRKKKAQTKRSTKTKKPKKSLGQASGPKCGLCGKRGRLMKTPCCDNWICDDYGKYQLFSFARNSCHRNHDRYTVCSVHFHEKHEGDDWRTCPDCREYYDKLENYVWSATNEYNFVKLENPPEYEPTHCAKCNAVIRLGKEAYSIKGDDYICSRCFSL